MTAVPHRSAFATGQIRAAWKLSPFLVYGVVFVAAGGGWLAGRAMAVDADGFESSLALLLRFMAVMKLLGVVAATGATHWRFTHPVETRVAFAYLAALVPMAVAPALIWSLGGIALGALLFHIGLLAFLWIAWKDDGVRLPLRR